ncbi:hypothetical protein ACGF8D_10475 [Streptomyces massasporeus]|uniref:hypothetical protein n=1 Tax=Streptomyces massasporeus TaxID=67324 RepID=UPI0037189CD2
MDFTDVLKNVRDGALLVPIVGTYAGAGIDWAADLDDEPTGTSRAIEGYFLKPGSRPLEKAMHGLTWLYDNGISQPLSTAMLMGSRSQEEDFSKLFSASEWAKSWHAANHISPGQALSARAYSQTEQMTGQDLGPATARELIDGRPLYGTPPAAYLPPGWKDLPEDEQQELLRKAGMPVVGNRAVEQLRRDNAFFTFSSGAGDFAARWWLDPVVLAGKGIGLARQKYVVTPRPEGGWSGDEIGRLMESSRMAKVQEFIWANKDNPDAINNLNMFRKSALGPRAGSIISKLQSPEEVRLFLRTTMGDAEARARLQSENAAAELRMSQVDERISRLELEYLPRARALANPKAEALISNRMDELRAQVQADEDLVARYDATLAHYAELDALNLTRVSSARALQRTAAQRNFRTGPALGQTSREVGRIGKSRIYADDMFGSSATFIRSFAESHPNGLIAIDDLHPEAIDELRAQVARIPGIGPNIRADILNNYLKTTTEGERMAALEEIQGLAVTKIAQKHGFTYDEGMALYREYRANITKGQEELRRYSGANFGDQKQSVDIFAGHDGRLKIHPNMVTKLANDQVLIDLTMLDKTLARNASALKALRTTKIGNTDWLVDGLDHVSHLWKFATLFRLGYIPRVLSDDLLGQTARLGAAAMAVRAGYGVKNLATNLAHWKRASHYEAAEATAREGLKFADEEIRALTPEVDALKARLGAADAVYRADLGKARARATKARKKLAAMDQVADPAKFNAMTQLVNKLDNQVAVAQRRLETHSPARRERLGLLNEQMDELLAGRDTQLAAADAAKAVREKGFRQASQLNKPVSVGGIELPPALAGEQGEYFQKLISSDDSLRTLLQRNKQMIHSNLQKSYNTKAAAPVSYPGTETVFVDAWHKAINHQIMQDPFARMAVNGASIDQMAKWLKTTSAGRAYRKRLGIKYDTPERIAASVWHEVDEYMPAASGVREAALKGEADVDYLAELAKTGQYPQYVHSAQLGEALAGSNNASRAADRVIDWWYKWAASLPADRMSRHPLFNQLYEGHARSLVGQELKQGVTLTQKDADRVAETARRLALKDTRKLVFDIAHRSDAAHMLRFTSPFFAATTEAWQRWARIIADRPQTVGYASIFFNAPISMGWMQDADGNKISRDGTAMVWDEKAKKLVPRFVPKGERYIMARVPKFVANGPIGKIWGMDSSGNWRISQDSMNLITQGDPWFNPGTGPVVSIPASLLVKDKPKQAELLRHMGVLPYGPTPGGLGDTVVQQGLPLYARNFLTAFDTSDERYQRIKLQIMQRAAYEHANLGKPMPSAQEIADRTKSYWLWSAVSAWTQPFATQKPDKYQFFRDQYNNLRRKNPMTADEEFLERFGESYFVFAQSTSENEAGVPATMKAVELQKKYADVIAKNPELAALIVGPEGNGPFSPEAYAYQLTTPLTPGGAESQRTRLSADEAMAENQRRFGWAKFTQLNNAVTAQLHSAGFDSFEDEGAEQFKGMRSAIAKLLGDPLMPDGSENPYYNEQWSKDYYTVDPKRFDRMIPGLTAVANSELAQLQNRSDLRRLQQYLGYRRAITATLAQRDAAGGSAALNAKSNADLAVIWGRLVDGLVESDTSFGDLYFRYLSRDLGLDLGLEEA